MISFREANHFLMTKTKFYILITMLVLLPFINSHYQAGKILEKDHIVNASVNDPILNDINENCSLVSHYNDNIGQPRNCELVENEAFLLTSTGLSIYDFSSPSSPQFKDDYIRLQMNDIIIENNIAFITTHSGGLLVFDISDRGSIKFLSQSFKNNDFESLALKDDLLFIAGSSENLTIVNKSNPNAITTIVTFAINPITCIAVSENYCFLGMKNTAELIILDCSNPFSPAIVDNINTGSKVNNLIPHNELLYLACGTGGMKIYNISNPLTISFVSQYNDVGNIKDIELQDSFVYLIDNAQGILVLDISNTSNPIEFSEFLVDRSFICSSLSNDRLLIADSILGFEFVDISTPSALASLHFLPRGDSTEDVIVIDDELAFLLDGSSGIKILDIRNTSNPTLIENFLEGLPSNIGEFARYKNTLYLSTGLLGMRVIDIINPYDPIQLTTINDNSHELYVEGEILYSLAISKVMAYSLKTPTEPILIGSYENFSALSTVSDLYVKDKIAFISAYDNGLFIIDFSNPNNPNLLVNLEEDEIVLSAICKEKELFVLTLQGSFIYDVSDVANPILKSYFDFFAFKKGILLIDNLAFLASSFYGLMVFDFSNYSDVKLLAQFYHGGIITGFDYFNKEIYLTASSAGLFIINSSLFPEFYYTTKKGEITLQTATIFLILIIPTTLLIRRKK